MVFTIVYIAGVDFNDSEITFTITGSTSTVDLVIFDDDIQENDRQVFVAFLKLVTPQPGVQLGNNALLLTIVDDDSKLPMYLYSIYFSTISSLMCGDL